MGQGLGIYLENIIIIIKRTTGSGFFVCLFFFHFVIEFQNFAIIIVRALVGSLFSRLEYTYLHYIL